MNLNIRAKTNYFLMQLDSFAQSILRRNWFHKRVWRDVGTKRHQHLDNVEIRRIRIYQTIDAFICLKFFSQHFLPYKSWEWWKLWINNCTYLDGFGNFKQQEKPENIAIYPSDRGNWDYTPEYFRAIKHMRTTRDKPVHI